MRNKLTLVEKILLESRVDFLKSKYVDSLLTEKEFDAIVAADPTKNKHFVQWIILKYIKEVLKGKNPNDPAMKKQLSGPRKLFFEDLYKLSEYLDLFARLSKYFPEKDINKYTFDSFKKAALQVKDKVSKDITIQGKGQIKEVKYKEFYLGEVDGFQVYEVPKGRADLYGMSCDLGSGTEWCTATGKTRSYFNDYIKRGPLFIFVNPKTGEKYQFSYEANQFMDKNDNSIF